MDGTEMRNGIFQIDVATGGVRPFLLRPQEVERIEAYSSPQRSRDGTAFYYTAYYASQSQPASTSSRIHQKRAQEKGMSELWLVGADGGEPRKLDLMIRGFPFDLHLDGKQIAHSSPMTSKTEVWVLENFLPPLEDGR